MGGIGRACAKLILFGEHAAVYGHTAIGVSMPETTTVRISGDPCNAWMLEHIPAEDRETVRAILARLEVVLPALVSRGRGRVQVESEVPRGLGFGSSAALCAAFARAALAHVEGTESSRDIDRAWILAHEAERLFHGTPSGIDTGLSLLGGLFGFQPRPPALPSYQLLRSPGVRLVVAAVPRDEACGTLIGSLGERMRSGHRVTRESIQALGGLAAEARHALETGMTIGGFADQAMDHLRRLGLSSPWLDFLLDAGKSGGALGGKLSGAGAGGAFFLVVKDDQSAHAVAARLEKEAGRAGILLSSPPRLLTAGE